MEMTAKEIERRFSYKAVVAYNREIRSKYNDLEFRYHCLVKNQETRIEKEVERRTKDLTKELSEKDKQIEALKMELAKTLSKYENDSSNSGIPTSQTPYSKTKYIPNSREKSNKKKGGQEGHKKYKLERFEEEEATEWIEVIPEECPYCKSKEYQVLETGKKKCETDYEVQIIKRMYQFKDCECKKCKKIFQEKIPNSLKEENQYGTTVQSMCVCLTNEIYTPFNKSTKLVAGLTNGEIKMSEGYVAKLQKRASEGLESFRKEVEEYFPKQAVYGWDEGVIWIQKKQAVLRTYCTDQVVLFKASDSKSKASIDADGILPSSNKDTIVMHDHVLVNYNEEYQFDNVECLVHVIRRMKKMYENTKHEIYKEMITLLSQTNKDRNAMLKTGENAFSKEYLKHLEEEYQGIIRKGIEWNEQSTLIGNPFKKEEKSFLMDLKKYEKNYLKWAYRFDLPSTNNNCERNIRPVKSKMKISGQFQNINYATYYATIRSYIETCKKNGLNIILACKLLMEGRPFTLEEILKNQKKDSELS